LARPADGRLMGLGAVEPLAGTIPAAVCDPSGAKERSDEQAPASLLGPCAVVAPLLITESVISAVDAIEGLFVMGFKGLLHDVRWSGPLKLVRDRAVGAGLCDQLARAGDHGGGKECQHRGEWIVNPTLGRL